jgi:hypothetical protein
MGKRTEYPHGTFSFADVMTTDVDGAKSLFPAEWLRRVVKERLGITPDEIDGGHRIALSRPKELAR